MSPHVVFTLIVLPPWLQTVSAIAATVTSIYGLIRTYRLIKRDWKRGRFSSVRPFVPAIKWVLIVVVLIGVPAFLIRACWNVITIEKQKEAEEKQREAEEKQRAVEEKQKKEAEEQQKEAFGEAKKHDDKGVELYRQGKYPEAADEFRLALQLYDSSLWHINLGLALVYQNKLDDAESEFREAVRLDQNNAAWHSYLAWALENQNKPEAEEEFRKVIQLAPSDAKDQAQAHWNLGNYLYYRTKRWDEAIGEYKKAIDLMPEQTAELHARTGWILMQEQNGVGAEKEMKEAVKLEYSEPKWHAWLAYLFYKEKRLKDAKQEFENAARFDKDRSVYNSLSVLDKDDSAYQNFINRYLKRKGIATNPLANR